MSNFIEDTKLIDEKISITLEHDKVQNPLKAAFLPFYVDPQSMKLIVLLKREICKGAYIRTGRKMGITCLTTILPEENPITIEEAYNSLNIPAKIQDTIPFGSVMFDPVGSDAAIELVLAQIEPVELIDEARGIVYQERGKYEIGAIEFDSLLAAVQENFIQDLTTRFMLSELYILVVEEANKQGESGTSMFEQGKNDKVKSNIDNQMKDDEYNKIDFTENTEVTENIPDDLLSQNSDMNFGAMYKS